MTQSITLSLAALFVLGPVASVAAQHSTPQSSGGQTGGVRDSSPVPRFTKLTYPAVRKSDQTDVYHGVRVADPYRWLEDTDSPETREWIAGQSALTAKFLDGIPQVETLRKRLAELWNYEKYDTPVKRGTRYFYAFNTGLQNQAVIYVQDGRSGTPRVLLDPNTLAADGTIALSDRIPSALGRYLAYGVAVAGSDWVDLRVRDVASGKDLVDTLKWIKFSSPVWTKDEAGFFYARYEQPVKDKALSQIVKNHKIYYHRIGTSQADDRLVYERPDRPDWIWDCTVSHDGRFLVLDASEGSDPRSHIFYLDLKDAQRPDFSGKVVALAGTGDARYGFVGNVGNTLYLRTDKDAPRGKIVAVDVTRSDPAQWVTVVPESKDVLNDARFLGGRLFTTVLRDAHSAIVSYAVPGLGVAAGAGGVSSGSGGPVGVLGDLREVQLPGVGSLAGLSGSVDDSEVFYGYTTYLSPTTIYEYDVNRGTSTVFRAPKIGFDAANYETRQVFYPSKDGTRIPMFITMKKGTVLDGKNPTLLYGYGGFNVSLTPAFNPRTLVWLEMGGVYAVANLRGGGEYGSAWHRAGTLHQKQNVFDDFIAAAEYLIAERYTSSPKLAINGGSNGGLLVGAVVNQRPELFGAAIPEVGVMDMLRFQKFTIGWAWTSDYGSSDDSAQFATLYKYSPLHNLKVGTKYPPTLVMTADHDDRVVPGHSFKYAAALQAAQGGDAPVLIRIETKAGHGAGKPTSKQIAEAADRFGFLVRALGVGTAGR